MAETSSIDDLAMEKIKTERLKIWCNLFIVLMTVGIGTFGVACINNAFQARQLEQQQIQSEAELKLQEKKAEAEHRQAEMKYLGDFVDYALTDDDDKRLRFAEYFAILTTSSGLQKKWVNYVTVLTDLKKREEDLAKARQNDENEKVVVEIQTDIERLRAKLEALPTAVQPSKELNEHNQRRFELDKNWRPLKYIENELEIKDEIVFDHATKLTWQKLELDSPSTYNEALSYINTLNKNKFSGYENWRLPSILELISLLKKQKNSNKSYINKIFDVGQNSFWSADTRTSETAWKVYFHYGDVYWDYIDKKGYVRAVR